MLEMLERAPYPYQNYKIASIGYDTKKEAYEAMPEDRYQGKATTYYHENKWYIIVED